MRVLIGLLLLFGLAQAPQMQAPVVKHEKKTQSQEYDVVTHTCPNGYEGHYVDPVMGFEPDIEQSIFPGRQGPPMYTICIKKEFMDEVRKNPDLLVYKPIPNMPIPSSSW